MVSFTPRTLYHQGKSPWYPLDRRLGVSQNRSGRGGEEKNSQPLPGQQTPRSSNPGLSHLNPIHTLTPCFHKPQFNIRLSPHLCLRYRRGLSSVEVPGKIFVYVFRLPLWFLHVRRISSSLTSSPRYYEGRLKSSWKHQITPRNWWSVVRSASLAKGGTSKNWPSPHLHKVPMTRSNMVSPRTFQTALVAPPS
jgi:hypothetical protein